MIAGIDDPRKAVDVLVAEANARWMREEQVRARVPGFGFGRLGQARWTLRRRRGRLGERHGGDCVQPSRGDGCWKPCEQAHVIP
jgi:hypothetical protein